jgi:hypothetical protein
MVTAPWVPSGVDMNMERGRDIRSGRLIQRDLIVKDCVDPRFKRLFAAEAIAQFSERTPRVGTSLVASMTAAALMAGSAVAGGDNCGNPEAGSCFSVHVAPSCADPVCCTAVCAIDPFCCEDTWDSVCRQTANDLPVCGAPVPHNDAPLSAQFSLPGLLPFTTVGATDSAATTIPSACGGIFGDEIRRDVWFEFRSDRDGVMTLNTCPLKGTGVYSEFDPILVLRDPVTFESIACNDEALGCGGYATLEFPTVVGGRYLVQLGGHDIEIGYGAMQVTEIGTPVAPPMNDACANAIEVPVPNKGASIAFDLLGAMASSSNCGLGLADVWYRVGPFEANGIATLYACSNDASVRLEAGTGSCADALACSGPDACVEGTGVEVEVAAGESVLVRVASIARAEGELSLAFEPVSPCPADLNGDGEVSAADLSLVLLSWGTSAADVDGDGDTTAADLSLVLEAWGTCG